MREVPTILNQHLAARLSMDSDCTKGVKLKSSHRKYYAIQTRDEVRAEKRATTDKARSLLQEDTGAAGTLLTPR